MEKTLKKSGGICEFLKAIVISMIFTLLLVLIFAVAIRFFSVETQIIPIVNQAIKCIAIVVAILISFTKRPNGWLRGFLFGLCYAIVSFLIFSAFSAEFIFDVKLLNDCLLGGVTGLIGGIIAVNVKKEC